MSRLAPIALALGLSSVCGCAPAEGTVLRRKPPTEDMADASAQPADDGSTPLPPRDAGVEQEGVGNCRITGGSGFVEQFSGNVLDATRWLVAHGNEPVLGERSTGGFVRENVRIEDNKLVLTVRGDRYQGTSVLGFAADGTRRSDGTRTGAAIATRNLYMSGTYQWEGVLSSEPGIKLVLAVRRAPLDESAIAMTAPGLDGATRSYAFVEALLTPGTGARRYQLPAHTPLDNGAPQNLRFDWHSGGPGVARPYVDFMDGGGSLMMSLDPQPARAARLWLVAFVPGDAPADFDSAEVRIETTFITPFAEGNDSCTDGELPPGMLVQP